MYRLEYTVVPADGRPESRINVGRQPTSMVPDVAATVASLVARGLPQRERRRIVSEDDFVNEACARALSPEFAGQTEEAQRLFQVVTEQEPEPFWPRCEYALCARTLRHWDVAEPLLTQLVAEAAARGDIPEQSAALNSLGILYLNRDEPQIARPLFEDVVRLAERIANDLYAAAIERGASRDQAKALLLLADIRLAADEPAAAIELLEQGLAIATEVDDTALELAAFGRLARSHLDLGVIDEAAVYVARLREARQRDPETSRLEVRLAYLEGDAEGAVAHMQDARTAAGEAWTDDDAQLLERYRRALSAEDDNHVRSE